MKKQLKNVFGLLSYILYKFPSLYFLIHKIIYFPAKIFDIKTLVSYMSSCMSLHPGDICCTGTPPGVGENMSPPHFLKGGEEVVLGVDNLGTQKHKVFPYEE